MQAENTQLPASGASALAARAGKRISSLPRATHPPDECAHSANSSSVQTIQNSLASGLAVPVQAVVHAHKPLQFFFEHALLMLAPCADLLGVDIARLIRPPVDSSSLISDKKMDSLSEESNARTE